MKVMFSEPDINDDDINEVISVLKSKWITTGSKTKSFELEISNFCNSKKSVCLNSATSAMEMILRLMGIGEGDEVITTAYTYTATCSVICHVGATPVIIDTMENSYYMDPKKVFKAITSKTKAIICVDLAGKIYPYYKEIFNIVEETKALYKPNNEIQKNLGRILIMADSAHSFGSSENDILCGNIADITTFSFHAVKNITTAEGGAITWNGFAKKIGFSDDELYKKIMLLSLHGQNKSAYEKQYNLEWEYDILGPYYKCNMTDMQAALGISQLKRYKGILLKRKNLINNYNSLIEYYNLKNDVDIFSHYDEKSTSSGHLYMIRINNFDRKKVNDLMNYLFRKGIYTNVHYKPLPLLTAYKNIGINIDDYINSYKQYNNELSLPLSNSLLAKEQEYVIYNIFKYLRYEG